jgi:hypothetical protein
MGEFFNGLIREWEFIYGFSLWKGIKVGGSMLYLWKAGWQSGKVKTMLWNKTEKTRWKIKVISGYERFECLVKNSTFDSLNSEENDG